MTVVTSPSDAAHPFTVAGLEGMPGARCGAYREAACVAGDEAWTATQPFPVRVVPADLVRGLRP